MLVPGLPQQQFPLAEQRLPGLVNPPPPALQALFQSCVAQSAQQRPSAHTVMVSLKNMQAV
jgi:DNA-binding helix-hairpin-helix protein with protein kinase domain